MGLGHPLCPQIRKHAWNGEDMPKDTTSHLDGALPLDKLGTARATKNIMLALGHNLLIQVSVPVATRI